MVRSVEISLSDNIEAAVAEVQGGADLFVEALAEEARERFRHSVHVRTGATGASASIITEHGSDYGANVAAAAALNPKAAFAPEAHAGPGQAILQVPIAYAAIGELGSSHRAAAPALLPAVESVASDAESIAREHFKSA